MKILLLALTVFMIGCTTNIPEQSNPRPILPGGAKATYHSNADHPVFNEWTFDEKNVVTKYFRNIPNELDLAMRDYREILLKNTGSTGYQTPRNIRNTVLYFNRDSLFAYQIVQRTEADKNYIVITIFPHYTNTN